MALPSSWVDHLFARLSVRYGAAFMRQWPDTDPAIVKSDWADVLDGFEGSDIAYALRYLPAMPMNALQFRDICRRAPRRDPPRLEAPDARPDPARLQALLARISDKPKDMTPAELVASNLRAIEQRQGGLTCVQRAMLEACETRGDVSATFIGPFTPINASVLPPAMRQEQTA